jgi:hypothetical protein
MVSGGDNKQPRRMVGAVTRVGQRLGKPHVLQSATTVRQSQEMIEDRGRERRGHTSASGRVRTRTTPTALAGLRSVDG